MKKTLVAAVLAAACLAPAVAADDAVAASPDRVRPLLIGATVPALTLTTGTGDAFDLGKVLSDKPTVVVFYRGGW